MLLTEVVRLLFVFDFIQSGKLVLGRDPEPTGLVQGPEEEGRGDGVVDHHGRHPDRVPDQHVQGGGGARRQNAPVSKKKSVKK